MRKIVIIAIIASIALLNIFARCNPKDETAPNVILLGVNKEPLKYNPITNGGRNGQNDTTIMLHTLYEDPGVKVEDNKSLEEDITVSSNLDELFNTARNNGYARRADDYQIVYTAIDEASNEGKATRFVSVKNISDFFIGAYSLRTKSNLDPEYTPLNVSISSSNRTRAGLVIFPKVYSHKDNEEDVSFRLEAYIYSTDSKYSKTLDNNVGYLGTSTSSTKAFYEGMLYNDAMTYIYDFEYLKIERQVFKRVDNKGNERTYTITGLNESDGKPRSRIAYDQSTNSVHSINLYFEVQEQNRPGVITVEEEYTLRYGIDVEEE